MPVPSVPSVPDEKTGLNEVFFRSVKNDKINIVRNFLEKKTASTNYKDENGDTALHIASRQGQLSMVVLLLEHKADRTAKNKNNETPIAVAASNDHWDCVEAFTKYQDEDGLAEYGSALYRAVNKSSIDHAEPLLKAGANPDWCLKPREQNKLPDSMLHGAVKNSNPAMIALLSLYKADFKSKNNDKLTPAQLAMSLAEEAKSQKLDETIQAQRWRCVNIFTFKTDDPELKVQYMLNRLVTEIDDYLRTSMGRNHRKRALSFKADCLEQKTMEGLTGLLTQQKEYLKPTLSSRKNSYASDSETQKDTAEKKSSSREVVAPHRKPSSDCVQDRFIDIINKYCKLTQEKLLASLAFVGQIVPLVQSHTTSQMERHSAPLDFVSLIAPKVTTQSSVAESVLTTSPEQPVAIAQSSVSSSQYANIIPLTQSTQAERDKTSASQLSSRSITNVGSHQKVVENPASIKLKELARFMMS